MKKEEGSIHIVRAFLRMLKQLGYYVRIRDVDDWQRFSREAGEEELVSKWEKLLTEQENSREDSPSPSPPSAEDTR